MTIESAAMSIAPPPLMRRTTRKPCRSAASGSTSFFTDWKLPITTAGSFHSQMRSVGLRRPAPTSSVSTWSSARWMSGGSGPGCTSSHS